MRKIMITWDGPYSLEELENGDKHLDSSKGLYQIYGTHPIYGSNVLLYIGKTTRSFTIRIKEEEHWWDDSNADNVQIYTGRIFDKKLCQDKNYNLDKDIGLAEQVLINTHLPAHNSSNINTISRKEKILAEVSNIRVINWHRYRDLMPEVSGDILVDEDDIYADMYIIPQNYKQ